MCDLSFRFVFIIHYSFDISSLSCIWLSFLFPIQSSYSDGFVKFFKIFCVFSIFFLTSYFLHISLLTHPFLIHSLIFFIPIISSMIISLLFFLSLTAFYFISFSFSFLFLFLFLFVFWILRFCIQDPRSVIYTCLSWTLARNDNRNGTHSLFERRSTIFFFCYLWRHRIWFDIDYFRFLSCKVFISNLFLLFFCILINLADVNFRFFI